LTGLTIALFLPDFGCWDVDIDETELADWWADDSMASSVVLKDSANSQITRPGHRSSRDAFIIVVMPTSTDMNARADTVKACEKSDRSSVSDDAPMVLCPCRERCS
jgi:hypothetical protein